MQLQIDGATGEQIANNAGGLGKLLREAIADVAGTSTSQVQLAYANTTFTRSGSNITRADNSTNSTNASSTDVTISDSVPIDSNSPGNARRRALVATPAPTSLSVCSTGAECGTDVPEGDTITLTCPGSGVFAAVEFVQLGNPSGTCGAFLKGNCGSAANGTEVLSTLCIGKRTCTIDATTNVFGSSSCAGAQRVLDVQLRCAAPPQLFATVGLNLFVTQAQYEDVLASLLTLFTAPSTVSSSFANFTAALINCTGAG